MYLYILSIHSGAKPETGMKPEQNVTGYDAVNDNPHYIFSRQISSWNIRSNPPQGRHTERKRADNAILGMRLWYSKECLEPKTLETTLQSAYKFGFGDDLSLENRDATIKAEKSISDEHPIFLSDTLSFGVKRIELPEGFAPEDVVEELMPFWDVSGVGLMLSFNGENIIIQNSIIKRNQLRLRIPYVPPPKEFLTQTAIDRFANYVESLNALNKAKKAWRIDEEVGVGFDGGYCIDGSNELIMQEEAVASVKKEKNRILVLKRTATGELVKRALMPCDMTPWLGTDLLPEFEVVKAVDWDPSVGSLGEATLSELAAAFKPSAPAATNAVPSSLTKDIGYIKSGPTYSAGLPVYLSTDEPVVHHNGIKVNPPAAPARQFPHQEDLDVLWEIFTREYIQRPKRAGGLDHVRIPNSILIAVWKLLALQPKSALLYGNPKYENSIIRKKDLPKNWAKVITPEVLTEYFYAKDENFQGCILYTFYNRGFLQTLLDFYDMKMSVNDNIDWLAFPAIDPTPIVLALTNPTGLTDEHKRSWVAKFVRERMEKKEKAVAGSQETYSDFISWVKTGLFLSSNIRYNSHSFSEFLAQFPQAEFTCLMKENGLTMTRRARGMVYVGATLRSKRDDDWTGETERAPAEGEILPGPTGATEPTDDGVAGLDATAEAEGNWASA